jgi:hypothetical protein
MQINLTAGMLLAIPYGADTDRESKLDMIAAAIRSGQITSDEVNTSASPPMLIGYFDSEQLDLGDAANPTATPPVPFRPAQTLRGQTISPNTIYVCAVKAGGCRGQMPGQQITADDYNLFVAGYTKEAGVSISTATGDFTADRVVGDPDYAIFKLAYLSDASAA